MPADSTATSPRSVRKAANVCRLVVLYPPAAARAGRAKVCERALSITREAAGEGGSGGDDLERFAIDDPEVSRSHAKLWRDEQGPRWHIEDVGSHNGTFVDGARIERAELNNGGVIRVGQHLLLMQELDLAASQRLVRRRLEGSPLVGAGPQSKWIDEQILACAAQDTPVLVLGESGTGKELVAKELHARSGRRGRFVAVNCTALAETIADSELFGHVQGAFSGATRARDGLFVEADGGSLLLDEIGDMPLPLQGKLLRAIETGEIRKVGSDRSVRVSTRVIAATHVDLDAAVDAGRFRGDLLARLQRAVIHVPPLRERREDILLLVRHFLRAAGSKLSIAPDAAEALLIHDWPYNVRELRNVVESAGQLARGGKAIELEHLPESMRLRLSPRLTDGMPVPLGRAPRDARELEKILREHGWNVSKVAALFGRDRKQIYRWCEAFGIELPRSR